MIEALMQGAAIVFTSEGILYCVLGAVVGYVFGFLPGLSGSIALTLLIPLTYGMAPAIAMIMLCGAMGGVTFGGSVTAIILNAPGTGSNAATCLDGYPMSRQGRAGEALGA